ncbi:MAG TPA: PQQ-dependent sugar dehydrogenase, partial [Candidatus Thermoplasmatota archaeon]|nr:PQQ-dependent sugar dehydrogenase [Candidatus Thermoplasmatota archaeon]
MARTGVVIAVCLVVALLAASGSAHAKNGQGPPAHASPPDHAKALGLTKHAAPPASAPAQEESVA